MMQVTKNRKIVFLILPQVYLLDLAGPVQVFHEALDYGTYFDLVYCGLEPTETGTASALPIGKLRKYTSIHFNPGDYLIIPGAKIDYLLSNDVRNDEDLLAWVNRVYEKGVTVCSVCTGAFFLAHTGLLNGRTCTTHWKHTSLLKTQFPKARVVDDVLFTEDERLYTSAGVTAGIDMALQIITKLLGDHMSFKVARELVVYRRRAGREEQKSIFMKYRNHIHTGVHRVQDYLQENIERGANIPSLSEVACMSVRSLTRIFKRETGVTINEYANAVRLERLRELIKKPDLTRKQMAGYCGLKSERQVIRLLKHCA